MLKILHASSLEELQSFRPKSPDCITAVTFSHDSQFLATADAYGCVGLYKYTNRAQDPRKPIEWVYMGRNKSHRAPITGLQFGVVPYGDAPRLMSIGEDKRLVEYNLTDTSIETGLQVKVPTKITQGAIPTGFLWTKDPMVADLCLPRSLKDGKQQMPLDTLLVATNEYKLKLFSSQFQDGQRQCIKTVLGPTYGGPLNKLLTVPPQPGTDNRCLVYSTHEK
eukprot:gene22568-9040_t